MKGNDKCVDELIQAGGDVNLVDTEGNTALCYASMYGQIRSMEMLLEAGADVNLSGKYTDTPLMKASFYGHEKCVELLINAGADVNIQIAQGLCDLMSDTEFGNASRGGHIQAYFLIKGADMSGTCNYGLTALMKAAKAGYEKCVNLLICAGADVNTQSSSGYTVNRYCVLVVNIALLMYCDHSRNYCIYK